MVHIEIKEIAKGQTVITAEGKEVTDADVFVCAARGFVGVTRKMLGKTSTDPEFARETGKLIESMLKDTRYFQIAGEAEGKEAAFMAALYGMNPGEKG